MLKSKQSQKAFTLIELIVVMAITALVLSVFAPSAMRFYDSVKHREFLRSLMVELASARYHAINAGTYVDVYFDLRQGLIGKVTNNSKISSFEIPSHFSLDIISAREVSKGKNPTIRFYQDGSSSGARIEVNNTEINQIHTIDVDWLTGRVTQEMKK